MECNRLPVEELAGPLVRALSSHGCAVVYAPTGSGKSTRIPRMLLEGLPQEDKRRIVVLQPRRLAARALARRVAWECGCQPGGLVGYHVRFERVFGSQTRILFITEGILPGMLADDPELSGVAAIVFDEFHERHLQSDVGIALARSLQKRNRPDLGIVVMSATLDTQAVATYLGACPVLGVEARSFPIAIRYAGDTQKDRGGREVERIWDRAAREFERMAADGLDGHTLIFMPGAYEIERTVAAMSRLRCARGVSVLPLHGGLSPAKQDAAIGPSESPKVIVATNVAETSLTIEGVTAVIDSGLAKVPRYDPRRGIDVLLIEKIAQSSAAQRAGRAGRTAPGRCIRLWSEATQARLPAQGLPEIARVDLSECLLSLKAMGFTELGSFPWLEPPMEETLLRATALLEEIGACRPDGTLTATGRRLARLPVHPRLARLLDEGGRRGCLDEAARLAALLQGRPILDRASEAVAAARDSLLGESGSDIETVLTLWRAAAASNYDNAFCQSIGLRTGAAREADRVAQQLRHLALGETADSPPAHGPGIDDRSGIGHCLVAAFADHLAVRDNPGTLKCSLSHGRRGELRKDSSARSAPLIVACEVGEIQRGRDIVVQLAMAAPVESNWIEDVFPGEVVRRKEAVWDPSRREVVARLRTRFRHLLLDDQPGGSPEPGEASELLARLVCSGELVLQGWDGAVDNWIARVNFLATVAPDLGIPQIDEEAMLLVASEVCTGATSYREIKQRPVLPVLKGWLTASQRDLIEQAAPESVHLPGRTRPLRVRYEPEIPRATISAKLQDFYDVPHSALTIVFGRIPLTVELLAPNGRPAQVTSDLDTFWQTSYALVKKELKGRYPKHEWR